MTHTITKHLVTLAAVLLPATGMANDFYVDGLYYDITGENTVEVANAAYVVSESPFNDVVIPATVEHDGTTYRVTAIGDGHSRKTAFSRRSASRRASRPSATTHSGPRASHRSIWTTARRC